MCCELLRKDGEERSDLEMTSGSLSWYLLNHETDEDTDEEAMAIALGSEEARPASCLCGLAFQFDSLADLLEFVLDKLVISVTVCMVFCQNIERFLVATFGDQPSGRFRDNKEAETLDSGE